MIKKIFFRIPVLILLLTTISALFVPMNMVLADTPGLHVIGSSIVLDMSPGQSEVSTITVSSDSAMDLTVEVGGLSQTLDGSTIVLSPKDDTGPNTARPFISNVDKSSLHLVSGVSQDIHVTISVPSGTTPGERYASIHLRQVATPNASFVIGEIIPVIINTTGYTPVFSGTISDLSLPNAYVGNVINFNTTFNNTGNCRLTGAKNVISIKDSSGTERWHNVTAIPGMSVLPLTPRLITVQYNTGLALGTYSVKSDITLTDGTVLATKTVNFNVINPPPIPTAPTLTAPGAGTAPGPVISSLTPSFQWNPVSGADSYMLTVARDPYSSTDVVYTNDQITGTSFTLPSGILFGGVKYAWQMTATNVSGTSNNSSMFYFQGPGSSVAPAVNTNPAGNIASSGATLNGNLTVLGSSGSVTVCFEYGTSTSYGNTTNSQNITAVGAFSQDISNLTSNTTYHFRAKAAGTSTVFGSDMTFTTNANQATTTSTPTTTSVTTSVANSNSTTTTAATINSTTSTTTTLSFPTPSLDIPDIIDASVVVVNCNNLQTTYVDAIKQADTEVSLSGISGTGVILVGKYNQEPPIDVDFSAGEIKGGTGKPSIKFIEVRVDGLSRGTARVTVHYTNAEISEYQPDSIFLAYYFAGAWHKCNNIVISAQDNTVSGDIPVNRLTGTIVSMGGDLIQAANGVHFVAQSGNGPTSSGINWTLIGIVTASILIIGGVVFVIERNRRKTPASK